MIYTTDFAPGATASRRTHSGQEFIYVFQGSLVIEPDGEPAQTVKAGAMVTRPLNRVYGVRNGRGDDGHTDESAREAGHVQCRLSQDWRRFAAWTDSPFLVQHHTVALSPAKGWSDEMCDGCCGS